MPNFQFVGTAYEKALIIKQYSKLWEETVWEVEKKGKKGKKGKR